jgi:hypothetical protein
MRWGWSATLIAAGLLLTVALSPVDEALGSWVGGSVAFCGVVVVPVVEWRRSRRREAEPLHGRAD